MSKQEELGKIQDALLAYLGLNKVDVQDWTDHEAAVDRATEGVSPDEELTYGEHVNASTKLSSLPSDDIIAKITEITGNTLNELLIGTITFENANELLSTIQAVDNVKELNQRYKSV